MIPPETPHRPAEEAVLPDSPFETRADEQLIRRPLPGSPRPSLRRILELLPDEQK